MPKKPEVAAAEEASKPRFVSITAGGDGELYALSESGDVYQYLDEAPNDEGWFQMPHDHIRVPNGFEPGEDD
jgi:hypothetical protein